MASLPREGLCDLPKYEMGRRRAPEGVWRSPLDGLGRLVVVFVPELWAATPIILADAARVLEGAPGLMVCRVRLHHVLSSQWRAADVAQARVVRMSFWRWIPAAIGSTLCGCLSSSSTRTATGCP